MQINNTGSRNLFYTVRDDNQFGGPVVINRAQLPARQIGSIYGINTDGNGIYNFRWEVVTGQNEFVDGDTVSTSDAGYTARVS